MNFIAQWNARGRDPLLPILVRGALTVPSQRPTPWGKSTRIERNGAKSPACHRRILCNCRAVSSNRRENGLKGCLENTNIVMKMFWISVESLSPCFQFQFESLTSTLFSPQACASDSFSSSDDEGNPFIHFYVHVCLRYKVAFFSFRGDDTLQLLIFPSTPKLDPMGKQSVRKAIESHLMSIHSPRAHSIACATAMARIVICCARVLFTRVNLKKITLSL